MEVNPSEKTRKLIHLLVGLSLYLLSFFLKKETLLLVIIVGGLFAYATFKIPGFRIIHYSEKKSLGTLFYPAGILSAFIILFPLNIVFFRITLLVLIFSDTLANLAGQINTGNHQFRLIDQKSTHGIFTYAISSFIIFLLFLPKGYNNNIFLIVFLVLLTLASEAISYRGSDNLSIPLVLALFFRYIQNTSPDFVEWSIVFTIFSGGSLLLYRLNLLSRRASLGAWLLGLHLAITMGWNWLLPMLLFFITSVIFTRLGSAVSKQHDHSSNRNIWQLTANSLWAVISTIGFLITQNELFIYLYIVFIASVTADTWASEAGPLLNKRVFSLSQLRMDKAGISGGVSLGGTLAAIAGASLISAASYYMFFNQFHTSKILIITLAAVAGTFADSLLGAFAEKRLEQIRFFRNHSHNESISPNDLVNLGGSLAAGLVLLALL